MNEEQLCNDCIKDYKKSEFKREIMCVNCLNKSNEHLFIQLRGHIEFNKKKILCLKCAEETDRCSLCLKKKSRMEIIKKFIRNIG